MHISSFYLHNMLYIHKSYTKTFLASVKAKHVVSVTAKATKKENIQRANNCRDQAGCLQRAPTDTAWQNASKR